MELKGHSQITYEKGHLFSTDDYKNIKNSKGSLKTEIVHSVLFCCQNKPSSLHSLGAPKQSVIPT